MITIPDQAFSTFPPLGKGRVRMGLCNADDFSDILSGGQKIAKTLSTISSSETNPQE
jgi:hypothetical protein